MTQKGQVVQLDGKTAKGCFTVKLYPKLLVGRGGLEPPTSRLSGVRSNHLSYRPNEVEVRDFSGGACRAKGVASGDDMLQYWWSVSGSNR